MLHIPAVTARTQYLNMEITKIVVASNSFKGSLNSKDVNTAIEKGILSVFPECGIAKIPISDGGEGFADILTETSGGYFTEAIVNDPLLRPVKVRYGISGDSKTAIIETASASGLVLVEPPLRNPMLTTTYGTGEIILDALSKGCRRFIVGIGGSATNDAGTGMLQALGFRFLDGTGNELGKGGQILSRIETIDGSRVQEDVRGSEFIIACDVYNPFSGPSGAAYVFAPQKGAGKAMVKDLDDGLKHFASVIKRFNGTDIENIEGAGAAGGLGGAFKALLGASLTPGIKAVLEATDFERNLHNVQLVITGEGKLDSQTVMGKAPGGILNAAAQHKIPVIAVGGIVEDTEILNEYGFTAILPIQPAPATLAEAMDRDYTKKNIERTIGQLMRLIKDIKR